jgi:O-methyltransferase
LNFIKRSIELFANKIGYHLHRNFWEDDSVFIDIYNKIKSRTLLKPDKVYYLYKFAVYAKNLPGDVAEVGVYRGGSAKLAGLAFKDTSKRVLIFDTFEGFQSLDLSTQNDDPEGFDKKAMSNTSLEEVKHYLREFSNFTFCKGVFPKSISQIPDYQSLTFCFVYIDVDIYQSTMDCLDYFYPRLVPGGVLLCDDYNSKKWGGVKKAVHEYMETKAGTVIQTSINQAVILKCG